MNIRLLTSPDARFYRELFLTALLESPTAFTSTYQQIKAKPVELFERLLEVSGSPYGRITGIFSPRGHMIGTIEAIRFEPEHLTHRAAIHRLYVHCDHRKQGYGRALLADSISWGLQATGVRYIEITVNATNENALKLYRSVGFRDVWMEPEGLCIEGRFYDLQTLRLWVGT